MDNKDPINWWYARQCNGKHDRNAVKRDVILLEKKRKAKLANTLPPDIYREYVLKLAEQNPGLSIPDSALLSEDALNNTIRNHSYNATLADYYRRYAADVGQGGYQTIASRVESCGMYWDVDNYRLVGVKDVRRVNQCHDRFCLNCQKRLQESRIHRFLSPIKLIAEKYDWYHMTLTVENVPGWDLAVTLDRMSHFFRYLMRFFLRQDRCAWYDFSGLGCSAGFRSFEVTYNPHNYHPHIHCLIALRQGLEFPKIHYNRFSYSAANGFRMFSDLEITLQKVWRLWCTGQRVTKSALDALPLGYSVSFDRIEGDRYGQVFKYTVKPERDFMTYEQWKTLYESLYRRRICQGYGLLYGISDDYVESDNPAYDLLKGQLLYICGDAEQDLQGMYDVRDAIQRGVKVISRKTIKPAYEED